MDNFHHLLYPQPGWTRQSSSFGRDPYRGSNWGGYRHMEACVKRILIAPGETHTMASLKGPGIITRIHMTTLLPFNAHALRNLVLRFYWDGEQHPSVESPFGDGEEDEGCAFPRFPEGLDCRDIRRLVLEGVQPVQVADPRL